MRNCKQTDRLLDLLEETYAYTGHLFDYAVACEKEIGMLGGKMPSAEKLHPPISGGVQLGGKIRDAIEDCRGTDPCECSHKSADDTLAEWGG